MMYRYVIVAVMAPAGMVCGASTTITKTLRGRMDPTPIMADFANVIETEIIMDTEEEIIALKSQVQELTSVVRTMASLLDSMNDGSRPSPNQTDRLWQMATELK